MRNVAALPEIPEVVGGGLPDISEIAKRTPVIKVIRWVGEKIQGCLHRRVIRSTGVERYLQPRKKFHAGFVRPKIILEDAGSREKMNAH